MSPSTCGNSAACAAVLGVTRASIEAAVEGFAACTGGMAKWNEYAEPPLGADALQGYIAGIAFKCGLEDYLPQVDLQTCRGIVQAILTPFDTACPAACRTSDDDDSKTQSLPMCEDDNVERSPASCGNKKCGDFLDYTLANMDDLKLAFADCDTYDDGTHFKRYAQYGATVNVAGVQNIRAQCGPDFTKTEESHPRTFTESDVTAATPDYSRGPRTGEPHTCKGDLELDSMKGEPCHVTVTLSVPRC